MPGSKNVPIAPDTVVNLNTTYMLEDGDDWMPHNIGGQTVLWAEVLRTDPVPPLDYPDRDELEPGQWTPLPWRLRQDTYLYVWTLRKAGRLNLAKVE